MKRRLKQLKLNEISLVDRPANPHARVTLFKRDPSGGADLCEVIAKRYIDPSEGARSFSETLGAQLESERFYEASRALQPAIYALECSLSSIAGDGDLTNEGKLSMMRNSVEGFLAVVRDRYPDVEAALTKAFVDIGEGESGMDELKKQIEALKGQVEDLTKQLEVAKAASEDADKAADLQKNLEEALAKTAELEQKLEAAEAEKAEAQAKADMSADERAHYDGLEKAEDQKAFRDMKPEDRRRHMEKIAKSDESVELHGRTIRKSVVGEDVFEVLKAQAKEAEENRAELAKQRERAQTVELTKQAEETLKHLPGETDAKVNVLKAMASMDEAVRKDLDRMLEAGEKAIQSAYAKIGHRGGDPITKGDPQAFEKRVAEIQKSESCDRNAALSKARERYPDEFQVWQDDVPANGVPAN